LGIDVPLLPTGEDLLALIEAQRRGATDEGGYVEGSLTPEKRKILL